MIRSPGTRRLCAQPIPEEALLKLELLGLKAIWERDGWAVYPRALGDRVEFLTPAHIAQFGWDFYLGHLADRIAKPAQPAGWRKTTELEPNAVPIPAAAVIDEDAFHE